ncbi:MAG: hypothetical protein ACRCY3_12785, partial [Sphingorhabdus sp.]
MKSLLSAIHQGLIVFMLAVGALSASVVPAFADNGQSGWKANDDDQLLLDVRAGKWRVGDGVRGYQT